MSQKVLGKHTPIQVREIMIANVLRERIELHTGRRHSYSPAGKVACQRGKKATR